MSAKPENLTDVIKEFDILLKGKGLTQEAFDLIDPYKDVENAEIQWRYSDACQRLGKYHTKDKKRAKELSRVGLKHADKAVQIDPTCCKAYFMKGILLDWSLGFEGYKKQIEKSFEIRENFDKACEADPTNDIALHVRGRWCYEIASIPGYMRKVAEIIFATPPKSSFEEALENFKKAEEVNPGYYCPNRMYLGKCYLALGRKDEAKVWLEKTISYDRDGTGVLLGDDIEAIEEAKKLLKSL